MAKDFPIYELTINDEDNVGVNFISIVDRPAIEKGWHVFSANGCSCGSEYGGEGSGCNGDNCGRPSGNGGEVEYSTNQRENIDKTVEYGKKNGISIEASNKVPKQNIAMASSSSNKIFINENHPYWKNPVENQKKLFESGWLSTENPLHPIYHETSHLKHKNVSQAWLNKEYQQNVAAKVSNYAKRNPSEFVAETYAGLKSGKKYDDDVMKLYKISGGKNEDFKKQSQQVFYTSEYNFKPTNKEKRIVSGAAMIANMPIYRRDNTKGEYFVMFKADTIRKIVEKYFRNKFTSNVNMNHANVTDGVYVIESMLIDKARGIETPKGYDELPDGSWFVSMKIDNNDVWENFVKTGTLTGFSVEGTFIEEHLTDSSEQTIKKLIDIFAQ